MKVYKKIYFEIDNGLDVVMLVGEPVRKEEFDKMFRLRYEIYSQHGYINEKLYPDKKEKDEYDSDGKSRYFIAMIDDHIVGSLRIIQDYYLPTEKECFRFVEPEAIKKIHRGCRAEVGRLIAKKYRVGNNFLPRHMTLLALFAAVEKFSSENNIAGGYAFIKNSLKKKLEKLMFPFHEIKPNEEIYGQGVLKPYFDQKKNPVIPIYFLASEIRQYFIGMTRFKLLLVRINENEYRFKKTSILKILLWKFFHILDRI